MKIAIDGRAAKWYRGTGIGTYTYQLLSKLNALDSTNKYLIFSPDGSSLENLNDNFTVENITTNSNDNFWDQIKVPNLLTNKNIDLYHVPQNGIGLSTDISCKKVITLHDVIPLKMPETVSDRYLNLFNNELPNIIPNCNGIITVSEFSKKDISRSFGFPKDKIYVTPLAAEDIYIPLSKNNCKSILQNKYSLSEKFILYVGGFSPRKNILGLINSFYMLKSNIRKNMKLVITGKKGFSYDIYIKQVIKLNLENDVIFTGFIPLNDLPIFYNAAEMLVYPSFYEGFGLPPLEAMACGTPVITSNLTSIPEVCSDAAVLINPYNLNELSENMERILTDTKFSLSLMKKGLIRSLTFSWLNTGRDTIKAYSDICSKSGC